MRAVLAALQVRYWPGEGLKSVVIATDSEYVFKGATEWVYRWQQYGWYTARGLVRNKDLWLALWAELDKLAVLGLQLYFWKIPRDLNAEADLWAREGAIQDEEPSFRKIFSVLS
ncbi:ribonuclease h [Grosmannia clavigera kw1407]|uniref:Ribonuclease h n=1 Tax=Grosmannia clavigera (strain kw1407 / UAMH 11150) TaxID=655863 RepID=F0XSN2_GROCL|nr:ribonuclease h [Grosmannia clavigera kw1407]EFW99168.1 ribonuclease h [Grosmannia clavigera kw1407]